MAEPGAAARNERNEQLIHKFYTAFRDLDSQSMVECYHPDITFQDPAFGVLRGKDAGDMWEMLISGSKKSPQPLQIVYSNVEANDTTGSAEWIATYRFSGTGREVVNRIRASFVFKDNLIIQHQDVFDFWKWRSVLATSSLVTSLCPSLSVFPPSSKQLPGSRLQWLLLRMDRLLSFQSLKWSQREISCLYDKEIFSRD
jgi:ketosteroid isomerase-like protein